MIKAGQNIIDITLERYGSLEYVPEIINLNRVSIDGDLVVSADIITDEIGKGDEDVKKQFVELNYSPING